ncbi:VanZ family protein [Candidatus Woesearchaeota archaeon]|nr:VanZ family protein [Candidatus Woesearchaeota archaeon]
MNKEIKKLIKDPFLNWLLVIAYATLIFIYSSMTFVELPSTATKLPDWVMHFIEYFFFGILLFRALFVSGFKKKTALFAVVLAFAYAVSDEVHQLFVGQRFFSFKDIIVDTIGAVIAQVVGLKKILLK